MTELQTSGVDVVQMWHNVPLSKRREIAAKFGVGPQGARSYHDWTMIIIHAAEEREQIEELRAAIAYAHLRS